MFLNNNYICANQYVIDRNIHIANVSNLKKNMSERDFMELGNCTFLRKDGKLSLDLKKYIYLENREHFDFTNYLPCAFLKSELELSEKELFDSGLVKNKLEIAGKKFYELSEFFDNKRNKVFYTLDRKDYFDVINNIRDLDFLKISDKKYLTWY